MKSTIAAVHGLQVIDSRGNPTVAVRVGLEDGTFAVASVPSGASTGEHEAVELRDGDSRRYLGKGVQKAVANVNGPIAQALKGLDATQQSKIDSTLCSLDGTKNKSKLGANAILGASLGVAHAAAKCTGKELFAYLGNDKSVRLPVPLVNVINGGAHANNSLDIQEFMIVPHGAPTFSEAIRMSAETFHALGSLLKNDGYSTAVGDEGGYAPRLESTERAFDLLLRAIEKAGYKPGEQISLALDVAASELVKEGSGSVRYQFVKGGMPEISAAQLVDMYADWVNRYPLVSIEDGLSENDWDGWAQLTAKLGAKVQLVGDDLFVTNTERIATGIRQKVANSVLIKLNQIGTVSETLGAIETAYGARYTAIISHRSGETDDSTIADLAVATNAGQIKTGSMCRGERVAKYNRLLFIEESLGSRAEFTNPFGKR